SENCGKYSDIVLSSSGLDRSCEMPISNTSVRDMIVAVYFQVVCSLPKIASSPNQLPAPRKSNPTLSSNSVKLSANIGVESNLRARLRFEVLTRCAQPLLMKIRRSIGPP